MKKILSLILIIIFTFTAVSFTFSASADKTSALPNVYAKMMAGEKIHVGYFGGSVTNGYGANQGINCWRGLSIRYLDETFGKPNGASFYEGTHAGLGGSGTELNLYRADYYLDLFGTDPVDLLFIEFAINDGYVGKSYERSAYHMESIINKVRKTNPTCDIVVILTTDFGYASGSKDFIYAEAHRDVAEHYGVPVVDFSTRMWEFLKAENGGKTLTSQTDPLWTKYYNDGCHPNAEGYAKYFEFLRDDFLVPNLSIYSGFSKAVVNHTLPTTNYNTTDKFLERQKHWMPSAIPELYNIPLRSDAYLVFPSEVLNFEKGYNFDKVYRTESYTTSKPGSSFTATFNSKSAGVFIKGTSKNGLIQYRVDGGKWQTYNMSSTTENTFFMFYEFLPEGEHTVEAILRKTAAGSEFTLRGFLVDGDSKRQGVTFGEAPNTKPLEDIYYSTITQLPPEINQNVPGNDGAKREIIHHHTDAQVLRFTPNTASTDTIITGTRTDIDNKKYKYIVVDYFYDVPDGTKATALGKKQILRFPDINGETVDILSADTIVANTRADAIFDISALPAKTNIKEIQLLPYGTLRANSLAQTEQMSIRSVSYFCDYPYNSEVRIPANIALTKTHARIELTGKKILPSAFPYLKLDFASPLALDTEITAEIYGIKVNKVIKKGESTAFWGLGELFDMGISEYIDSVNISATASVTLSGITLSAEHPFHDKAHEVYFNANGGVGIVPEPVYMITVNSKNLPVPELTKNGTAFVGWSAKRDSTELVKTYNVPEYGVTLYAVYEYDKDLSNCPKDTGCPIAKYTDLKTTSWYHDGLHYCIEIGAIDGPSENLFGPSDLCTRATVVTVLYRIDGEPRVTGSSFMDVEPGSYFEKAVIWAQKNNIVTGVSDIEFAPERPVTREQLAAIIYRYAKYKGFDLSPAETTNISGYTDYAKVGTYALPGIKYTVGTGLIKGKTATTLNPKDTATRAEICTIVMRFMDNNK